MLFPFKKNVDVGVFTMDNELIPKFMYKDIVKVNNEDSEFIILHIDDASLQLAELGEGIISNGNEVEKIDW